MLIMNAEMEVCTLVSALQVCNLLTIHQYLLYLFHVLDYHVVDYTKCDADSLQSMQKKHLVETCT